MTLTFVKRKSSRIRYDYFASLRGCSGISICQLARYLRKARGSLSYADFSKKVGVSHTTLHRIEQRGEHHITLDKLETILSRLKIKLRDFSRTNIDHDRRCARQLGSTAPQISQACGLERRDTREFQDARSVADPSLIEALMRWLLNLMIASTFIALEVGLGSSLSASSLGILPPASGDFSSSRLLIMLLGKRYYEASLPVSSAGSSRKRPTRCVGHVLWAIKGTDALATRGPVHQSFNE